MPRRGSGRTRLTGASLAVTLLMATGCAPASRARAARVTDVAPVTGPSWLSRAGLSVTTSKMGALGGDGPPPATGRHEPSLAPGDGFGLLGRLFGGGAPTITGPFMLTGADLYRFSCQSCHGPTGAGDPPAINSLLGPVRATSQALLERRLGATVSAKFMAGLLAEARTDLADRIVHGGKQMPSFSDLRPDEMKALVHYLKVLAHVPDAGAAPTSLEEPGLRVGQFVVEGTCQVCHDATGPGGMAATMRGLVPSLASLPMEDSLRQVVAKVRRGVNPRGMMGRGGMMGGGMMSAASRMPKLRYLTAAEVVAAYAYLRRFPPGP